MRKTISIVLILVFFSCSKDEKMVDIIDQPESVFLGEIDWVKSFGGSGLDTAQSIISTSEGGYAVFGFTNSTDGDISDRPCP